MNKEFGVQSVDYMRLLYENRNISVYELDAILIGENRGGMSIDEDCVERSLASFADMPLYCVIDNKYFPLDSKHNDFLEHFRENYPDRITRDRVLPFGTVPESSIQKAKLVERDGRTYLRIQAVIWKRLLPHISEILQRRDGSVNVSVEFSIKEATQRDDGIIDIHRFEISAITAIGEKFEEVMEGCRLKTVRFAYDNYIKECSDNYFCFAQQKDYSVPDNVVAIMKGGLALREKYGRGGNKKMISDMKKVVENKRIFESQLCDIQSYFSTMGDIPDDATTNKYILFSVYGGSPCMDWVNSIIKNSEEGGERKGMKIVINNSREAAVDSKKWGNPGKELYGPLMESEDSGGLLREAYLIVDDGYEDAPSENLKYPHHLVKDGELVLDIGGVEAAFQRASAEGIVKGSVKAHLKRHYDELGLSLEKFAVLKGDDDGEHDEHEEGEEDVDDEDKKLTEMTEKCAAMETRCSEIEEKCAQYEKDIVDKDEKLAVYMKRDTKEKNEASIKEFAHCFDEKCMAELVEMAENMSCDEMDREISRAVMSFAKLAKPQPGDEPTHHFSFSVNPFLDINEIQVSDKLNPLERIIKKSKTKV